MSVSKQSTLEKLLFKAISWSFEDVKGEFIEEDEFKRRTMDECIIYVSGITEKGESVMVKITGWTPYAFLELAKGCNWNKSQLETLETYLKRDFFKQNSPNTVVTKERHFLQYNEPVKTMFIPFNTYSNMKEFERYCSKTINVPGLPPLGKFTLHETKFDPVVKFATARKINLAGWLSVPIKKSKTGFSTCDKEITCCWKDVVNSNVTNIKAYPYYCSFDIECYSVNPNSKLPDPENEGNVVFQISLIFGRLKSNIDEKILLSLGNPLPIEGVVIISCKTERDLLLKFTSLIQTKNPDIFIGYNIIKFDWNYLLVRANLLDISEEFLQLTRLVDKTATIVESSWSSSAYGQQKFKYPDCTGRMNVDVLVEIDRNYRLASKRLEYAASFFLNDHKKDITPRQLFMLCKITLFILPKLEGKKLDEEFLKLMIKKILDILQLNRCSGEVLEYRQQIEQATIKTLLPLVRKAMTLTGAYCVYDSILPIRLVESLNMWDSLEALANVTKVPLTYLHTRGQGIKVAAQLLRETYPNIVIPTRKDKAGNYQGAKVLRAVPGMYEFTITNDFASLYPSIIIMFNICYTTCLKDSDPTPDSECIVLEWKQHMGCEHDPLHRKLPAKKTFCANRRYRFKRPIVEFQEGNPYLKFEGIMPKLERDLLKTRKLVKDEMDNVGAQLKMNKGQATEKDLSFYKFKGWAIISKGSLSQEEVKVLEFRYVVLNATQLALKISANSMYGAYGAKNGGYAVMPECAESVTAMGRMIITEAIEYITRMWPDAHVFYGDTDSCMSTRDCIKDSKTLYEWGREVSKKTTHYLKCKFLNFLDEKGQVDVDRKYRVDDKEYTLLNINSKHVDYKKLSEKERKEIFLYEVCPISLAFETACRRILLLTKKKYVCVPVEEDGKEKAKTSKGNMLVVRKNSAWCKKVYSDVLEGILANNTQEEIINKVADGINGLFTRSPLYFGKSPSGEGLFDERQLLLVSSIKDVMGYAKKQKKKDENEANVFIDKNGKVVPKPKGPLDPRLVYANTPHVQLALKLLKRGDSVPPNTQLEYLFVKQETADYKSEKMEEFQYYSDHRVVEKLKPDLIEYVSQLGNSVEQLIYTRFPAKIKSYEKLEDKFNALVPTGKKLVEKRVQSQLSFKKDVLIGWECLNTETSKQIVNLSRRHLLSFDVKSALEQSSGTLIENTSLCVKKSIVYKLRGIEAKIESVIKNKDKKGKIARRLKSRLVLSKLRKSKVLPEQSHNRVSQYKISLRTQFTRPSRSVEKMKEKGKLMIKDKESLHHKATTEVLNIKEGKKRLFDLAIGVRDEEAEVDNRIVLKDVPEDKVRPYIVQNKLVSNMKKSRACFEEVLLELKSLFE